MTSYGDTPVRANSTTISTGSPIAAGYTELAGDSEVLSNQFHLLNTAGLDSSVRCEQAMSSTVQSATVVVGLWTQSGTTVGPNIGACTRMSTGASASFYCGAIVTNAGPSFDAFIFRFAANAVLAVVATGTTGLTVTVGDVLTLTSVGNTHTFTQNGVSRASGTDTNLPSDLRCGWYYARAAVAQDVALTSFAADDGYPGPPRFSYNPVYRM